MPEDMVKKYRRRFLQEGFICKAVDSGFYALTMLEREKPNLIIATEDIEDLEIYDLLEIIDSDPDLSETHIIVLSENLDSHSNKRCMTLSRNSDFEAVLATAYQLLNVRVEVAADNIPINADDSVSLFNDVIEEKANDDTFANTATLTEDDASATANGKQNHLDNKTESVEFGTGSFEVGDDNQISNHIPASIRYDTSDAQITGELATDQLVELIKTFAMGSRGLLIVRTPKADGRLLLEHDRLLKAEFNNTAGQEAFNALLQNVFLEDRVSYFFKRYDNALSSSASKGKGVALSYLLKISEDFVKV